MNIDDVKPKKKFNIEVEPKELDNRINEIFYTSVKALSFAVTFLFLIYAIGHLTLFKTNMMTVLHTVMSFLLLFALMNLVLNIKINPKYSHLLATPENMNIEIVNELPAVKLEKTRIKQIFQNLLSNALKYNDKPKGEIKIGCEDDGEFWKFSVEDNGPGIDEKYFAKVFRIFQTLESKDDIDGTGIGLAIVKKIIDKYDGKIWLESEPGEGLKVVFTIPKLELKK